MSTALQDLPDPLQPPPALPSSSPDDLLAKMADEAIDQLMAGAEKGIPMPPPAFRMEEDEPAAETPAAKEEPPAVSAPAAAEAVAVPEVPPAAVAESHTAVAAEPAVDQSPAPAPAADMKALLHVDADQSSSSSPLLWPLWLINAPFTWLGDRGRTFAGLLAIVTLVPAACAIIWVLFLKK